MSRSPRVISRDGGGGWQPLTDDEDQKDATDEEDATDEDDVEGTSERDDTIQVLGEELEVDDNGAAVVMVFPRMYPDGPIMPDEVVEGPSELCHKLFRENASLQSGKVQGADFEGHEELLYGTVTMEKYQQVVRRHFGRLLTESGLRLDSFPSVDGDETFLRISLPRDGQVIRRIAAACSYPLAYRPEAYAKFRTSREVGKPMSNRYGPAPAFAKYNKQRAHQLVDFKHQDEVRLIERRLSKWVIVEEMVAQKVISKHFPVVQSEHFSSLAGKWATWRAFFSFATFEEHTQVKEYFGARVAFFFLWLSFYSKAMIPLAVFGAGVCAVDFLVARDTNWIGQLVFAFVMVVWAIVFHKLFRQQQERAGQCWGAQVMHEFENTSDTLPSFNPDIEGTIDEKIWRWVRNTTVTSFMMVYGILVSNLESLIPGLPYPLLQCVLIRSTSWVWSHIAAFLVEKLNHRTEAARSHELTILLSIVKIYAVLMPLVWISFFKKHSLDSEMCDSSAQEVAAKKWGVPLDQWPSGLSERLDHQYVNRGWINKFDGKFCIPGCFPNFPTERSLEYNCITDCEILMQTLLVSFYGSHLAFMVVNMLYPLVRTMYSIHLEKRSAKEAGRTYTLLQYQAKCHDNARYEFDSWGGSHEDDFLEMAQGFAVLTCFGQLYPVASVAALAFNFIAYRLFAYRMLYVTCRPFPRADSGIGGWAGILETIGLVAVLCNIWLVLEMSSQFRQAKWSVKMLVFVCAEHICILVRLAIRAVLPDVPTDVQHVEEHNAKFKNAQLKQSMLLVPAEEAHPETSEIDLGHCQRD